MTVQINKTSVGLSNNGNTVETINDEKISNGGADIFFIVRWTSISLSLLHNFLITQVQLGF